MTKGRTTPTKNPGPPGWGLGVGLITPPRKTSLITETGTQAITGVVQRHAGLQTMRLIDGAVTTMSETRKGAHSLNKSLADPKTKVKIGCWNARTMFSM